MPLSRLREVPWDALRAEVVLAPIGRVLEGAAAEREVDRALRSHRKLSREERAAVAEGIFGVALWRRRLAWHAGLPSSLFSGSAPAPASRMPADFPALLLASLLRDLAGLPEARALALTGLARMPEKRPDPESLADRWSLPDWLEAHLRRELGAEAEAFCAASAVPGPVCLRANRLVCTREELAARLAADGIATRPAQRAPDALIVESQGANLFGSFAWRDGLFEPQDEGSQLVGLLAEPRPGETVLDLCAGAGGKSLLFAAQGARVLAFDANPRRLRQLRDRAERARAAAQIEIVPAPRGAEIVFVDAPCSELGILRRGPDSRWRIQPESLAAFPPLQRELLETALRHAGRRIVYATCTVNHAENEDLAQAFERAHPELRRAGEPFRVLPHTHGTDGFFAAVWER